jgi:hypothetical protein
MKKITTVRNCCMGLKKITRYEKHDHGMEKFKWFEIHYYGMKKILRFEKGVPGYFRVYQAHETKFEGMIRVFLRKMVFFHTLVVNFVPNEDSKFSTVFP